MIYALVAGLVVGYGLAYLGYREERRYLRDELKVAHAQIAHAVLHDHALIPPRVEPMPAPEPLSGTLQAVVDEWESPDTRATVEQQIRGWLAEGWGETAILRQYGVKT